ncbi:MAG: citrate lyase holo-[acyl-carrier protein] synthase [Anaeromyxobacteraceae bacterium]
MDRSSTPCDASRRRLLAARDARQEHLDAAVREARGGVVALSLAIPGADTAPRGADALFSWAAVRVAEAFADARAVHAGVDALGPFALWDVGLAPAAAKAACVAIEASRAAARLLDLDVYSPEGAALDRAALGLPPRRCLCCDAPARECIALRRHSTDELARSALLLLAAP